MRADTVVVLGANGTMGKNVSAIFASFGEAKVYMVCRSMKKAEKAGAQAFKTVRAESIRDRLIPATYDDLEKIVPEADIIFESVAEAFEVKEAVNEKVVGLMKEDAILCTGTSGLSINKLAGAMPENVAKRYMGMHFFNPPYNLVLCELIPNDHTDSGIKADVKEYLTDTLHRTVVEVKDEAGFLGNKIGFFFINEALQYAEKYKEKGGIDYIDSVLGGYTGRGMMPIVTADFVGLDVHKAIVDNVYDNGGDFSKESFKDPAYVEKLIAAGKLGKKTGEGVYKTVVDESGKKQRMVYDICSDDLREIKKYDFAYKNGIIALLREGDYDAAMGILAAGECEEAKIARDFLVRYVVYSLYVSGKVCVDISGCDDAMATGFGWVPPLAVIDAFGGKKAFAWIAAKADMGNIGLGEDEISELIAAAPASKYDYRRYIRAL